MPHDTPLIATIAIGLGLAFLLGLLAQRLRLPPIVGYLMAGVIVGPFTPGYVADQGLANELAEIGVILLMFGVGLHFSLRDLMSVRAIAIPGALGQIGAATLMGMGLAWALGWSPGAGLVFGLSLSVASTVVLLRALQERNEVESEKGRIAVGWLIVEDLAMVVTLVLLPPLAGLLGGTAPQAPGGLALGIATGLGVTPIWATLGLTAVKVGLFVALMLVLGRRVIPAILHHVAHTGSRELFRLGVLAIALGVAYGSANLFGVSFALGAFFAGMVLAESPLATQAAKETLPLRDAFAVLFFVSVGMLFDPAILLRDPATVLATFAIITLGKSAVAYAITRAFGHDRAVGLTIAASLAQIGEFSFILVVLGVQLALVPEAARDLVVAGAILSILVNPLAFRLIDRLAAPRAAPSPPATGQQGHVIVIGAGAAGAQLSARMARDGIAHLVVEEDPTRAAALRATGVETLDGEAAGLLPQINLPGARALVVTIRDGFEAGHLVQSARETRATLPILALAADPQGAAHLADLGAQVLTGQEDLEAALTRTLLPAG